MPFRIILAIILAIFIIIFGIAEILLFRSINKRWWQYRFIRLIAFSLPLVGLMSIFTFVLGLYNDSEIVWGVSVEIVGLVLLLEIGLIFSLPFSGFLHWLDDRKNKKVKVISEQDSLPENPGRRQFLRRAAIAIPLGTVAMTGTGIGSSFQSARVYRRELYIPSLPDELVGLRILHLSDLHLSHFVTLNDLESTLEKAADHKPDLILVTGDIADDLKQLPEAIRMINSLKPSMGSYASLGNHEYFRGAPEVRRILDREGMPLLVDDSLRIKVADTSVFIGGIDDPRFLNGATERFFRTVLDRTLQDLNEDDFRILMSHRPDVFPYAEDNQINLTLAGHTHGAQIGLFGRSILEPAFPEKYLWGEYYQGDSLLYTTSGMGHWFPFRLGCPPEAPILELRRKTNS